MRGLSRIRIAASCLLAAIFVAGVDILAPPPLERAGDLAAIVMDRNDRWLHAFTNAERRWRFAADLDAIDQSFVDRLIAIEDKRFYSHWGVDIAAVARAARNSLSAGEIVSGASTITMQTARLLEPRKRTIGAKLIEMLRAAQLERRLTKREILELYLTLAPYGGNLEGVRAASLFYFGKEPGRLNLDEQALLIALPQAPEARRPDRRPEAGARARAQILARLAAHGAIDATMADEAAMAPVPRARHTFPRAAYHFARRIGDAPQHGAPIRTTIDIDMQIEAERLVAEAMAGAPDGATAAALVLSAATGEVLAAVGSGGFDQPGGWIDLTRATRSPGSLLKPFIYGVAFEDGALGPDTLVRDMPRGFGGYRPENFDRTFRGEVRVREALQHSLNVPAVAALEAVGARRFVASLRNAGAQLKRPRAPDSDDGLAVALGGAGVRLVDVAALYLGLSNDGAMVGIRERMDEAGDAKPYQLFSPANARRINSILRGAPSLAGRGPAHLSKSAPLVAYKTGTSYGYRDAWAAGHGGGLVVAVWTGRADGGSRPGQTGRRAAAPVLFSLIDALAVEDTSLPFDETEAPAAGLSRRATRRGPEILFPRDGVAMALADSRSRGVRLTASGGAGPRRWYVDGEAVVPTADGAAIWRPDTAGFYRLEVFDEQGNAASVRIQMIEGL